MTAAATWQQENEYPTGYLLWEGYVQRYRLLEKLAWR